MTKTSRHLLRSGSEKEGIVLYLEILFAGKVHIIMEHNKRTTVIFVRHAKAQYGEDDRIRPLTEDGLKDRQVVLDTLKERTIDCFYSNPYKRSIETIQSAADYFEMPILTDERFQERKVDSWNDACPRSIRD